jgi:hypothetical protein
VQALQTESETVKNNTNIALANTVFDQVWLWETFQLILLNFFLLEFCKTISQWGESNSDSVKFGKEHS